MSCRESTQLSPTVMQRAALQAFLDLENIMSQDVELSQLRFAILPSSDQMGSGMWLQLLPPYYSFFTVMWDQSMLHGSLFQKTSSTGHNCCSQFQDHGDWLSAFGNNQCESYTSHIAAIVRLCLLLRDPQEGLPRHVFGHPV